MKIDFDFSQITSLVADLDSAPERTLPKIRQALEVTARRIKDEWRDDWKGSEHVKGANSITYDIDGVSSLILGKSAMSAEIGPDINRHHGGLVGMLEYGTPNTGPRGFGAAALKRNEPDFEKGILKATEGVL